MDQKSVIRRVGGLVVISLVVLAAFVLRLVEYQLVKGAELLGQAESVTSYEFSISAARGEIVDRYGRSLASNQAGYNLVVNKLTLTGDLNQALQQLVLILQQNGEDWNDTLPIDEGTRGSYSFVDEEDESVQKRLTKLKENLKLQQYATADQVMARIVEKYELESFDAQWQRILGGIRYQMQLEDFSVQNSFVLAQDISDRTVATVKERSLTLSGAEVVETSYRVYEDGTIIPHYLGSVGSITSEQWWVQNEDGTTSTPLRDKGYNMNDIIGQSGVEAYAEDRLRGKSGTQQVTRDKNGVIVSSEVLEAPQPGETVVLTINRDLQAQVNEALANLITTMQQTKAASKGREVTSGAAVVIDVKTGGILAISNYPSYDLNLYKTNYSEYNSDPNLPLMRRATSGLYTPGSSFKPAVALDGLLNGVITGNSTVYCSRVFTLYEDYRPGCQMINHGVGPIDVVHALTYSCNTFFYDTGHRLGLEHFDEMATRMGLATETGFELGEAIGNLTHTTDENYSKGLELQAAIGQGNTQVTPIQLATYANTIANRGTRYKTHLIAGYRDTNTGELLEEVQPQIMEQIEDNVGAFDLIEQGMIGAARNSSALKNYPLNIAVKTGSPQRWEKDSSGSYYTNSTVVAYGPVEDPEIAIGIVLEWGGGGSNALPLVASIFDAYYSENASNLDPVQEGQLLP